MHARETFNLLLCAEKKGQSMVHQKITNRLMGIYSSNAITSYFRSHCVKTSHPIPMKQLKAVLLVLIGTPCIGQSLTTNMLPSDISFEHGSDHCLFESANIEEAFLSGITLNIENYNMGDGNTTGTTISISSAENSWQLIRTNTTTEQTSQFELIDNELVRTERITVSLPDGNVVDQTYANRSFYSFPMEINQTATNGLEFIFAWSYTFMGYSDISTPFYDYENLVVIKRTMSQLLNGELTPADVQYQLYFDSNLLYPVFSTFNSSLENSIYFIHHLGIMPLEVSEHEAHTSFQIYPNPSRGFFHVKIDDKSTRVNGSISLLNLQNHILKSTTIHPLQSTYFFETTDLAAGAYLVCLNSELGVVTKRVVVE
jgi:hypothetical protein